MSKITKITAFFLFFVVGFSSYSLAALVDSLFFATLAECRANCTGTCIEMAGISLDGSPAASTFRCNASGCGTAGTTQSKYAASGCTYTTTKRTCCSDGSWTSWGGACPKTCDSSTKPSTSTTCYGGTKTRTVTCSNGSWVTGSWGSCSCTEAGFEKVTLDGGGTCCQKIDGTGLRCAVGQEGVPYGWVDMGTNCRDKVDCGTSSLPTCNSSLSGSYWSKWDSSELSGGCGGQHESINGRGKCREYLCRQG